MRVLITALGCCGCVGVSAFVTPLSGHAKSGFGGGLADTSRRGARPLHVRVAMMSSRLPVVPDTDAPRSNSAALPFLPRPEALDGTMIGDVGFDPLGFAAKGNLDR
ncbi:unnamed protein product [Ectocarpus sp. CCAP 1310/34]|nr:unnamed protein product [Ectocarpus sp. CCAP 1310/34]